MLDRDFTKRADQSIAAKIANLKAFREAEATRILKADLFTSFSISDIPDSSNRLTRPFPIRLPSRLRRPAVVVTTTLAAGWAAACGGYDKASLTPDAQHQAAVEPAKITPVPSVLGNGQNQKESSPTPEPTRTPEVNPGDETDVGERAVIHLDTYDFAIKKWQDLGVLPRKSGRTLVVEGVLQNKTDKYIGFNFPPPKFNEGYSMLVLDKNGNPVPYGSSVYYPYGCGGLFNDPYVSTNAGTLSSVADGYQKDCVTKVNSVMAPGFGLPIALVLEISKDTKDIKLAFDSQGTGGRQTVEERQIDQNYPLIPEQLNYSNLNETLHVRIPGELATDLEYKVEGFTKVKPDPASKERDAVVFRVTSNSVGVKEPFTFFSGQLYLKDGRVIPLATTYDLKISPGQTQDFSLFVGELPPTNAFKPGTVPTSDVVNAYDFDLKGSTLVVFTPGASPALRAWEMPSGE